MKKLLVAAIVVAFMIGSYFLGKHETAASLIPNEKDQAQIEAGLTSVSGLVEAEKATHKPLAANKLPLPPANTPLNEMYIGLQQRAESGDGKAACRLAIELVRCQQALNMSKYMSVDADIDMEDYDKRTKPVDKLKIANSIDEHRLKIMEKAQHCRKLSTDQLKQTFRYLRQAAKASQPDAMVAYIDGRGLEGEGGFALVRSKDFDIWRSDALPLAQRALQQGVPEAVYLFSNAYSDENSLFSGLITDDVVYAETMRLLRLRIEGKALLVDSTLNASDYQRALSQSQEMFSDYFHGKVQPKSNFVKRLMSYSSEKNEEVAPCE